MGLLSFLTVTLVDTAANDVLLSIASAPFAVCWAVFVQWSCKMERSTSAEIVSPEFTELLAQILAALVFLILDFPFILPCFTCYNSVMAKWTPLTKLIWALFAPAYSHKFVYVCARIAEASFSLFVWRFTWMFGTLVTSNPRVMLGVNSEAAFDQLAGTDPDMDSEHLMQVVARLAVSAFCAVFCNWRVFVWTQRLRKEMAAQGIHASEGAVVESENGHGGELFESEIGNDEPPDDELGSEDDEDLIDEFMADMKEFFRQRRARARKQMKRDLWAFLLFARWNLGPQTSLQALPPKAQLVIAYHLCGKKTCSGQTRRSLRDKHDSSDDLGYTSDSSSSSVDSVKRAYTVVKDFIALWW